MFFFSVNLIYFLTFAYLAVTTNYVYIVIFVNTYVKSRLAYIYKLKKKTKNMQIPLLTQYTMRLIKQSIFYITYNNIFK